jgi:hypothetical protein
MLAVLTVKRKPVHDVAHTLFAHGPRLFQLIRRPPVLRLCRLYRVQPGGLHEPHMDEADLQCHHFPVRCGEACQHGCGCGPVRADLSDRVGPGDSPHAPGLT